MPTMRELFDALNEQEEMQKVASLKKKAIQSPHAGAGDTTSNQGAAIEDATGGTGDLAATKLRIRKKLEEMAGAQQDAQGQASEAVEERLNAQQDPELGAKMPPASPPATPGVDGITAAAAKVSSEQEGAEEEKVAAEELQKIADEYHAAGQFMARGFVDGLNELLGDEESE